jgi:hypothetical protein
LFLLKICSLNSRKPSFILNHLSNIIKRLEGVKIKELKTTENSIKVKGGHFRNMSFSIKL